MFKKGEKVICIKKDSERWGRNGIGPKYLEEVTVNGTDYHPNTGELGYSFFEYDNDCYYCAKLFRRPFKISKEVKNSFPEIIEEKIDIPQLEPTL